MTTNRWDAVVVGGGPAGSATAAHLARAGARVLLVERSLFPRDKPCSEYLSPGAAPLLQRLGVFEQVASAVHAKLYGMTVVAPGGAVSCGRFGGGRYSFALPRTTLDTILLENAARAGAVVHDGVTVDDLTREGGAGAGAGAGAVTGIVGRYRSCKRETLRASVVVGADGLRSVVARRLGRRISTAPRRIAFAAHLGDVTGVDGVGELHVSRCGYVGLGPIGGGVTTVALVLPLVAVRGGHDIRSRFFDELDRFPGLRGRFDRASIVREILVTGPFAQRSRRATADGALLVGDAADFFDPFTGQGLYSALKGAELAAAALLPLLGRGGGGRITRAALRPYARARRAAFAGKWVLERLIGLGVGWPALTDRVVGRLARRPALADLLVGATGNFVPARRVLAPTVLAQLLL